MPPLCDCVTVSPMVVTQSGHNTPHSSAALNPEQCHWVRRGAFCEAQGKGQVYQIFVIKEQIAQNCPKLKKRLRIILSKQKPVRSLLCLLETRTVDRNCELANTSSSMVNHDTRNCMLFIY